jgi:hypothetical protein
MVHLSIPASRISRRVPQQTKRLDSWIQNGYVAGRNDPDDSNRHITSDLPTGVVFLRSRVCSSDCLDPNMSLVPASTDKSSHDFRAVDARAGDADSVPSGATMAARKISLPQIRIAHLLRA